MTTLRRRDVLRAGALAAGALATGVGTRATPRRVVIVRLHGGADGLSMVVPWRDPAYRRARPTIAVAPPGHGERAALDLDGTLGLHPRLASLLTFFRRGLLDIVPACGLARVTRSHLVDAEALDDVLARLGAAEAPPVRPQSLAVALAEVAAGVRDGKAPDVTVVHSRGWDHHAGQRGDDGPLAAGLEDLARGLETLVRVLGTNLEHTTVATVSEFGRAVRENGHGGTDHGHATAMLLLGGTARRGRILGGWPGLGDDQGLRPTVLVGEALARWA